MSVEIVGDRFLRVSSGWIDLATGEGCDLDLQPAVGDARATYGKWQGGHRSTCTRGSCDPRPIVDEGPDGPDRWFVARGRGLQLLSGEQGQAAVIQRRVRQLMETPLRPGIEIVSTTPWESEGVAPVLGVAPIVRQHGFVPFCPSTVVPGAVERELAHRHLALFVTRPEDREPAVCWARRLARSSDRTHLLVLGETTEKHGPESGYVAERGPVRSRRPEDHLARGLRLAARGRHAASRRSLCAAYVSAERDGYTETSGAAACHLLRDLVRAEHWAEACRLAEQVLLGDAAFTLAGEAAAAVLIRAGCLVRAEVLLGAVRIVCRLEARPPPRYLRAAQASVCLWQGRLEAADRLSDRAAADNPELVFCRGLLGWMARFREPLSQAVIELDRIGVRDEAWRIAALALGVLESVMRAVPGRPRSSAFEAAVAGLVAACSGSTGTLDPFIRCVVAEALMVAGEQTRATAVLGPAVEVGRGALLTDLLVCRVRSGGARSERNHLEQLAHRMGAHGVLSWGQGRTSMYVLSSLPNLLQGLGDAEDDLSALRRTCEWLCRHAGATAAGIVAGRPPRLLVGEGLRRSDLDGAPLAELAVADERRAITDAKRIDVGVPIRMGGRHVGGVIARGTTDCGQSLVQAAEAVAPLCAGAVRSRLDAEALIAAGDRLTPEILGRSPAIAAVRQAIARAAATGFPVLIEGESGTGKELAARALHRLGARRDRSFCAVNCAALSDDLVEAELFGHARGAFTGAIAPRAGLFEEAHGGTLFLDEIGELTPRAQAKLLRALQEREIRRLGENASRRVDVRIIAATNRSLPEAVGRGSFREDLLFRLAVVRLRMPALRDRVEDIALLAHAFWRHVAPEVGRHVTLGVDALAALARHRWSGNVRELQNAVAGLAVVAPSRGRITARHVQQVLCAGEASGHEPGQSLEAARRAFERRMIAGALARHAGRRAAAAHELGLTRQGLAKAMRRVGLGEGGRGVVGAA